MSNMSYCRFQNTLSDLRDCYESMDHEDLSQDEAQARIRMIRLCQEIAHDFGSEVDQ